MNSKIAQLQTEVDKLTAQITAIDLRASEVDELINNLRFERDNLVKSKRPPIYSRISSLKYELEILIAESQSPIYETHGNGKHNRIVSVDRKFIGIKYDGDSLCCTKFYKITDGWMKGKRSQYGAIDAQKALAIWNEHLKNDAKADL